MRLALLVLVASLVGSVLAPGPAWADDRTPTRWADRVETRWAEDPEPVPVGYKGRMHLTLNKHDLGWGIGTLGPLATGLTLIGLGTSVGAATGFFGIEYALIIPGIILGCSTFYLGWSVWPVQGVAHMIVDLSTSARDLASRFRRTARSVAWTALVIGIVATIAALSSFITYSVGALIAGILSASLPLLGQAAGAYAVYAKEAERLVAKGWTDAGETDRRRPRPRLLAAGPTGFTVAF